MDGTQDARRGHGIINEDRLDPARDVYRGINTPIPLQILTLPGPPDTIAFSPIYPDYFVVGTYELQQDGTKYGLLIVCKVEDEYITKVQEIALNFGIYDVSFDPYRSSTLAVTGTTGWIMFYDFRVVRKNPKQEPLLKRSEHLIQANQTVTSLAWHPYLSRVAVSCGTGDVLTRTIQPSLRAPVVMATDATPLGDAFDEANLRGKFTNGHNHDNEAEQVMKDYRYEVSARNETVFFHHHEIAWVVVYTPPFWSRPGIISGADNGCFQFSDIETDLNATTASEEDEADDIEEGWANHSIHQYGVTALLPLVDNILMTGSYDGRIRIIQLPSKELDESRQARQSGPRLLTDLSIGCCCWRMEIIEAHDLRTNATNVWAQVLVNSHDGGPHIIEVSRNGVTGLWNVETLCNFPFHGRNTNTYASGMVRNRTVGDTLASATTGEDTDRAKLFVSSSMVNRELCLWAWGLARNQYQALVALKRDRIAEAQELRGSSDGNGQVPPSEGSLSHTVSPGTQDISSESALELDG